MMELYKILDSEKKTWKDVVDGESRPYTYKLTTPDTKAANTTVKYYPVSRVEGTTEWLTVSDPVLEYALATYDAEGKVTITLYPTDKLETTIEVEGNKYVSNNVTVTPNDNPDALTIKGTPTGIKTIQATDAKTDDAYYNLSGQRVSADFKGIVIHNGKKILKK